MPTTGSRGRPSAPTQAVGIFWRVAFKLVVDRSALADAEPYGECLTHPHGHYDRWQEWQSLGRRGLVAANLPCEIATSEYDDWPRGRIIYQIDQRRFVIYADRRLQHLEFVAAIRRSFGLEDAEVRIRSDLHYR